MTLSYLDSKRSNRSPAKTRFRNCALVCVSYVTTHCVGSLTAAPLPEATNCSLMLLDFKAPARNNGGKVEEDSEVAISKYRRKRWSASSGVEFEGTPRQDSVAEIYKVKQAVAGEIIRGLLLPSFFSLQRTGRRLYGLKSLVKCAGLDQ